MKEENFSDVQKLIALKRHEQPNDTYFEELLDEFHRRQRLEQQKRPACSPIRERVGNWFSETSNWKLIWAGSLAYSVLLGVLFIWPKDIDLNAPEIPNTPVKHLSAHNKRMFILSSMDASSFHRHSQELNVDHYFEAAYAGVLDKRDQIHHMMDTHQLDPSHTVFLGDMQHDIETARHGEDLQEAYHSFVAGGISL